MGDQTQTPGQVPPVTPVDPTGAPATTGDTPVTQVPQPATPAEPTGAPTTEVPQPPTTPPQA